MNSNQSEATEPIEREVATFKDRTHESTSGSESKHSDYINMSQNKAAEQQDGTDGLEKRAKLGRSISKPATIIFSLIFLTFGIFLVINSITQHYDTLHWPAVNATVLSSDTDVHWVGRNPTGTCYQYRDYLKIKYNIFNTEYISKRIVWSGNWINLLLNKNSRETIMSKCIEGTQITVYHSPQKPRHFVLERGSLPQYPGRSWLAILFGGLVFTLVPLVMIFCIGRDKPGSMRYFLWKILVNYQMGYVIMFATAVCIVF